MSKKLLMNNVINGGNVNKCPVCGEAEDQCTCTPLMVDDIYLGWAIAGKYAGVTACTTDTYSKGNYYYSVFQFNTKQFTLFNEKMVELGFTRTTDYYDTSADYMTYYNSSWTIYWNTYKYSVNTNALKSDLNFFLRDFTYEQLELIKNYGKTNYPYADILKMYAKFFAKWYENVQNPSVSGSTFVSYSYYKDTKLYNLYNHSVNEKNTVNSALKKAGFKTETGDYPTYPNTYNYVWVTGNEAYVQIQPIACIINYYLKHPEELT